MKKNIYILGLICLTLILFAVIFKISHWPGAAILLIAGIGSLVLIFLPIAYAIAIKNSDDKLLKNLYTAAFISFSVDFIGMLFKIMHWPGAGIFMMIGIPLPFILFLPVYIYYHIKRKLKTDLNFFAILLFMIYVGVFSTLLALKPGLEILNSYAQSTNALAQANKYLSANTFQGTPSEISNSSQQLANQIEEIKHKLLVAYGQETLIKPDKSIDYTAVLTKDLNISLEKLNECGFKKFNEDFEIFNKTLRVKSTDSNSLRLIEEIDHYRFSFDKNDEPLIAALPYILIMNVLSDWQNKLLLINYMNENK
jgi:hypothetical protein